jgi:hypothetical protein
MMFGVDPELANERSSPTKLMKSPGTLPMFILTWKELGIDERAIINKEVRFYICEPFIDISHFPEIN